MGHAINSCIEMDLTGQAASSDIGKRTFSGFGGQVDFLRGAQLCPDGKAFLQQNGRHQKEDAISKRRNRLLVRNHPNTRIALRKPMPKMMSMNAPSEIWARRFKHMR